ncbi:MAG: FKBP-type peptidyl-prolyl cis-trans isomerase [Bacteroidia bacterium]|nr:FKBP-type peptidyl-prolyl cis-trans isomerase [Bacteroidia bacterium]
MKKTLLALLAGSMAFMSCKNAESNSTNVQLETKMDSISYALGCLTSDNYKKNIKGDFNIDMLVAGMRENFSDSTAELKIPISECEMLVQTYAREQYEKEAAAEASKNLEAGEAFLKENGAKEGVQTLPSGLQYKVINQGSGEIAGVNDKVKCHYTGRFIDGKVFDSSLKGSGEPIEFAVTGVIPGWTEALQIMPAGSKWELYIPAHLAYGAQGRPGIPGNSTLIFELELLDIIK